MSKVLRVGGDYKVIIQDGGTITLDTTNGTNNLNGRVVVTGSLEVKGTTTTVDSTTVTVADNIIVLSKDNSAAGIPASLNYRSGIEIERGSLVNAFMVYDEQISWTLGGTSGQGTWTFEQGSSTIPIKTNGIVAGGPLYLQTGADVVTVTGTVNYEEGILTYVAGTVTDSGSGVIVDDDGIPNTKAMVDYVDYVLGSRFHTYVEANDFETDGLPSNVEIGVNNVPVANFYSERSEFNDIRFQNSEITSLISNGSLVLSAPGTGTVTVRDVLEISSTPGEDDALLDPSTPANGIRIYSKDQTTGGSGLYFVNKDNTADEIISRNRALVFSMLF
jgi:hypothetical protein